MQTEYKKRFSLEVMPSLGFNNTFAIVIRGEDARRLNLRTLSKRRAFHPRMARRFRLRVHGAPGRLSGPGARRTDCNSAAPPRILDLGLLYRALLDKQVDLVAGNSTDGLLAARDLVILEDDKHYFPPYEAVPIVREDTLARHPEVRAAIAELAGKISDAEMQKMNYAVAGEGRDASEVAREFLHAQGLD